jgi:hypothetical protein
MRSSRGVFHAKSRTIQAFRSQKCKDKIGISGSWVEVLPLWFCFVFVSGFLATAREV